MEWHEASSQIKHCVIALAAILGHSHPNAAEHQRACQLCETLSSQLHHDIEEKHGKKVGPALFVFHWQLHHRSWFFEQWGLSATSLTPPPKITDGLMGYLRNNRLDWLPEHGNIPTLASLARTNLPGRVGGNSGVPAPPSGTPRAGRGDANTDRAARVRNANRDPRFVGNTPLANNMRTRQIRDATVASELPIPQVTRNGIQMDRCLSHHLKGVCTADCDRASDHVILTAPEADELHQWCIPACA